MQSDEERKAYKRGWYQRNKRRIAERQKLPEYRARKSDNDRRYRAKHPEKLRQWHHDWYEANKDSLKVKYRQYRGENKEQIAETHRKWCEANPEKRKAIANRWVANNLDKCRAQCAKRRAKLRQALPTWVDVEAIKAVYLACPTGYEIDHIYPLTAEWVCGLHVVPNLQYLLPFDNVSKNNRFDARHHFERTVEHPKYRSVVGLVQITHDARSS